MRAAYGLFYPALVDCPVGSSFDNFPKNHWFLDSLRNASEHHGSVGFRSEQLTPAQGRTWALLNTLDMCYGHSVLKLLSAEHYLRKPDIALIVLVQPQLRWLVPDGVARVWTAEIPFKQAPEWWISLAQKVGMELATMGKVQLCPSMPQPAPDTYHIENFTRVAPFPLEDWEPLLQRPKVTFVWRSDRFHKPFLPPSFGKRPLRTLWRFFPHVPGMLELRRQEQWIACLAEHLRRRIPNLDFAVGGMGESGGHFADWIKDLRVTKHDDNSARALCQRYAQSHLVVGCNGSSLLLPSAHAGATLNLAPKDWWAVCFNSFAYRGQENEDRSFRYTVLPGSLPVDAVANVIYSILFERRKYLVHHCQPWNQQDYAGDPANWDEYPGLIS